MRWKYLLPLVIFLFLAGFLFKGLYLDPRKVPSALIDGLPEYRLPTLEHPAKFVSKQDMLGRVYLLNVWASWCQACQYEHPFLVDLKAQGKRWHLLDITIGTSQKWRAAGWKCSGIRMNSF